MNKTTEIHIWYMYSYKMEYRDQRCPKWEITINESNWKLATDLAHPNGTEPRALRAIASRLIKLVAAFEKLLYHSHPALITFLGTLINMKLMASYMSYSPQGTC